MPDEKKPPVSQVLIEMALHAGVGIGSGVIISQEAGAFWDEHYKTTVAAALAQTGTDWTKDRKNALAVAVAMGTKARALALATRNKTITRAIAKDAARDAAGNPICPSGAGRFCP